LLSTSFYYVTGANFEDAAATYDLADDKLILWIPSAGSARDVLYSGRPPTRAECEAITDVDQVRNIGELDDYLRESLFGRFPPGGTLYILDPAHVPGAVNTIHLHPRFARRDRLASPDLLYGAGFDPSAMQPKVDSTSLRPAMDRARVRKTPYEVAQIRRANAVSGDAHRAVLERLARMASERDVEAVFLATSIRAGARSQAYAPIAGSGENASMLHYSANADPLADRTLLVLDAGAEWACYASDVTRTLPLAPAGFPPAAQRVYDAVARMQAAALALVRPGRRFLALQAAATVVAADALRTLGLLRGPLPDILRTGVVAAFFPHGLGHHVGLEVHDVLSRELLGYAAETHDPPVAGTPRRRAAAPRGKRQLVDPSWCAEVVRIGAAGVADGGPVVRDVLEADMVVTIEPGMWVPLPPPLFFSVLLSSLYPSPFLLVTETRRPANPRPPTQLLQPRLHPRGVPQGRALRKPDRRRGFRRVLLCWRCADRGRHPRHGERVRESDHGTHGGRGLEDHPARVRVTM